MNEKSLKKLIEDIKGIEKAMNCNLNNIRYTLECADSLWKRCPYKEGQLVELIKTPEITNEKSWGWLGAKHFLIQGARARISYREFYGGKFVFGLQFQDETWIDYTGKIRPVDRPSSYSFCEDWIKLSEYEQLTCEAL